MVTKDTTELIFRLKTDPASPVGETKSLFCQVVITQDGEPIVHNLGSGRLRIDAPLPPKPNAPARPEVASATPEAPEKPLSRLEKLRLESQERAKAAAASPNASRDEEGENTPPPLPLTEAEPQK